MIKEQINITCGGNTYENCTLIVPSQVQTSTPQEETLDLEKSPNFQIVVPSIYFDKGTYEVTFSVGGNDCTANMIVMNNGSVNLTLQYVDGLTVEEAEPEPDKYYVNADNITNATVTFDKEEATEGETITMTVTPDSGYVLDTLEVVGDTTGTIIDVEVLTPSRGEYSFIMPAENVNVHVECVIDKPADTFQFGQARYECSAVYNGTTTEYTDAEVVFLVNGVATSLSPSEVSISGISNSLAQYMALDGGAYGFRCTAESNISTSVTVTATYNGMTATTRLVLQRSENIPEVPSFTYSGSDQNNPIQVNIDLANYPGGEMDSVPVPEVNININYPSDAQYYWLSPLSWGNYQELNSNNNNDCTLLCDEQFWGTWSLGDGAHGYYGPRTAGTYLRSYSVTFTYIKGLSGVYDETTDDQNDDPVAQALDGTVITFWVQYNVTGTIPTPQ